MPFGWDWDKMLPHAVSWLGIGSDVAAQEEARRLNELYLGQGMGYLRDYERDYKSEEPYYRSQLLGGDPGAPGYGAGAGFGTSGGYAGMRQAGMEDIGRLMGGQKAGYGDLIGYGDIAGRGVQQQIGKRHEARWNKVMGRMGRLQGDVMEGYGGRTAYAREQGADITGGVRRGWGGILPGYGQRLGRAKELMTGLGEQEQADIQQAYGREQAGVAGQMAARGMGGTTIGSTLRAGIGKERTAALGRLGERTRRERIGWESQLSGEELAARERGLGAITGTRERELMRSLGAWGEGLGAQERMGMAGVGYAADLSGEAARSAQDLKTWAAEQGIDLRQRGLTSAEGMGRLKLGYGTQFRQGELDAFERATGQRWDRLGGMAQGKANLLSNVNIPYPNMQSLQGYMNYLGQQNAPQPETGGSMGWLGGAMGGMGSAVGGKLMAGFCVDGEADVNTQVGIKRLKNIKIGDEVYVGKARFARVTERDYGESWPERKDDFVTITAHGSGTRASITLTKDHPVAGKPASEWKVGERIVLRGLPAEVERIEPAKMVPSGDIALDNAIEYMANGFLVTSLLGTMEMASEN